MKPICKFICAFDRVYGTKNLRVVDASVMPFVPRGNTNLPTMLIAARAAEIILSGSD